MAGKAEITVAALYCFARMGDLPALKEALLGVCKKAQVRGTILLAPEGINGTIAGTRGGVAMVVAHIRALPGCAAPELKYSTAIAPPFNRMKVRLKREIVTMGQPDIDSAANAGTYVDAADWNALLADPDTVVIDTRNAYEVAIGTFAGAVDPHTASFGDFPAWFRANRTAFEGKRIAMFCTGGIRCEKSTSFLRSEGVEDVHHLQGGILRYLETVPQADSRWQGECFVFDERVAVGVGLAPGSHVMCRACRRPVSDANRALPAYVEGVSCPACISERDDDQRARYAERQRQETLAEKRGTAHVGR